MMPKFQEQLEKLGVDKPRFYYELAERVTVCLLTKDGAPIARGVAICSMLDQFERRIGRAKALGRAVQALQKGESTALIRPGRFELTRPLNYRLRMEWAAGMISPYKATFMPKLTGFEDKMVNGKKPGP